MGYIKRIVYKNGSDIEHIQYYYFEIRINKSGKHYHKRIRKATAEEIAVSNASKKAKNDIAYVTCANPECDRQLKIPRKQKRSFNTTYLLRYSTISLPYCSAECRDFHDQMIEKGRKKNARNKNHPEKRT